MAIHAMNTMTTGNHIYFTPKWILDNLGEFDLDPCTSTDRPFRTAKRQWCPSFIDGLKSEFWCGRVWMNPPYGRETGKWMKKLADHSNGIALIFARTETSWFFSEIWDRANAVYFFKGRIHFYKKDGSQYKANAGAPSCLVAYGANNVASLIKFDILYPGKLILLKGAKSDSSTDSGGQATGKR